LLGECFFSLTLLFNRFCKISQYVHLSKFQEEKGCWLWKKLPPLSKRPLNIVDPIENALNPPLKRAKGAGGKAVMK